MKMLAVLLLCSAALVAAQKVTPEATNNSCYQLPTCDTPPGTDGWTECTFTGGGSTVRVCTAVCNTPYFTPTPNDPTTICTTTNGWADPTGKCVPTAENCVNTQPSNRSGSISSWDCSTLTGGDYAKKCSGTCAAGYTPSQGEDPAAHCNRYTGKWEITGGCVQKVCSTIPDYAPPAGSIGWDSSNCQEVSGLYVCTAPCKPDYTATPTEPKTSCSPDTGDWTAVTGACKKPQSCGKMPPADTNPTPTNSQGWSVDNCQTVGNIYTCTATCNDGFTGDPTAGCDKSTGVWSPTIGTCKKSSNLCSKVPPLGTKVPANSQGWTADGCSLVTPTTYQCEATCNKGYVGSPTIDCNPTTGKWGPVIGQCVGGPSGSCTVTPVSSSGTPLPNPAGSTGWDEQYCFTSSGKYTCQAPCLPGYEPVGSIPYSICTVTPGSSTGSWSAVTGKCQPVQPACSTVPPYAPPDNSIGWRPEYCREVNGQYTCTAYCQSGYTQGPDGLPSASCDVATGQWTSVGGSCERGSGGCSGLPTVQAPKNSLGWRSQTCYTTGYGPKVTTTCFATCDIGYVGSGTNGGDPYSVCDFKTGTWSAVNGFCIPEGSGGCDSGYPNVPDPENSYGWSCTTMGWGPYVQRVCTACCKPGFYGYPCAPSITCTGSGSWSNVKGACVPYQQPSKPCWGYPGNTPTCHGGKAKWTVGCGGAGYCWKSRTYAKNCGRKCNLYCPSYVKHGTQCKATCSGGASGYFYSTCYDGKWSSIGGSCTYK